MSDEGGFPQCRSLDKGKVRLSKRSLSRLLINGRTYKAPF
jgi:hypothetical protein